MIREQLAFAVAYCGLTPDAFGALTPEEWEAISKAVVQRTEAMEHSAWERARIIAYSAISPYLDRGTSIQSFLPFHWEEGKAAEEQQQVELPTEEERAAMIARYAGITNN